MQTSIIRGREVLAEMVSNGDDKWKIRVKKPKPGVATWIAPNGARVAIEILERRGEWLVIRRPNGLMSGVKWTDGGYWLNWLCDRDGKNIAKLVDGAYVVGGQHYASNHVLPKGWWR
jgi:hypothetical protein